MQFYVEMTENRVSARNFWGVTYINDGWKKSGHVNSFPSIHFECLFVQRVCQENTEEWWTGCRKSEPKSKVTHATEQFSYAIKLTQRSQIHNSKPPEWIQKFQNLSFLVEYIFPIHNKRKDVQEECNEEFAYFFNVVFNSS